MTSPSNKSSLGIIGASSMVGSRFCELSKDDFNLIRADLNGKITVDVTKKESVDDFFKKYQFDSIILFSAFTDVDAAQKDKGNAHGICWQINTQGTAFVVENCLRTKTKLIFISTDFVFDGTSGPYDEETPYGPDLTKVSWYGVSKIEAERLITKALQNYLILRITYPYRASYPKKEDFARKILRAYVENSLHPMFCDQKFTPTFADDLASAIKLLLEKKLNGIFHIASPELSTPYDFATKLLDKFGLDSSKVEKGYLADILKNGNATPRPLFGGLNVDKIKSLGFVPTGAQEGINKLFDQRNGRI